MENCGYLFESSELWYSNKFPVLLQTCFFTNRWDAYPSQIYRNTAVKIMLGVNLNVIVNSDSNLDQIVF